ncbi:MAG: hypothetical protein KBD66_01950 [Candidatus Doudnabacteria bacterium]|nr:hypothetical protein [Candidatus Doudnabacteria bacterium]
MLDRYSIAQISGNYPQLGADAYQPLVESILAVNQGDDVTENAKVKNQNAKLQLKTKNWDMKKIPISTYSCIPILVR